MPGDDVSACPRPRPPSLDTVLVVVVVVVRVGLGRDDLAARVVPADGADAMGPAGAVALRAGVDRRGDDLVLRAALRRAAVGLLLLGYGHGSPRLQEPFRGHPPHARGGRGRGRPRRLRCSGAAPAPPGRGGRAAARQGARLRHALATDPAGCWVAERADGVVGAALAIRREGLWGLSLLAVAEEVQGQGVGQPLLATALDHARGARGGLILSSTDPRAMRLYARSGFALRPCVGAAGIVEPHAVTAAGVQEPERAGPRADRGRLARRPGGGPRCGPRRVPRPRRPDALRRRPGDFIAAGHDWAVEVCLSAGMALSPGGPIFTRGDVGPMAPYLPSGAWL